MTVIELLTLPFALTWQVAKEVWRERRLAALPEPTRTFTDLVWQMEELATSEDLFKDLYWRRFEEDLKRDMAWLIHAKHIHYNGPDDIKLVVDALRVHRPQLLSGLLQHLETVVNPPPLPRLQSFWLSWYHDPKDGPFNLKFPWWKTDDGGRELIYAAVRGYSEKSAKDAVLSSYEKVRQAYENMALTKTLLPFSTWSLPNIDEIAWRSCELRPDDWSPWSSEFPREDGMEW